jgi:dissimilatory sulfite reductase (desulfoviridin) alpha/beta subunit
MQSTWGVEKKGRADAVEECWVGGLLVGCGIGGRVVLWFPFHFKVIVQTCPRKCQY